MAEKQVKQKMLENQDTQAYFYEPVTGRNERNMKNYVEKSIEYAGTR